jgi:adenylyltransferase/sulfurtransferase
VLGSVVGVIGCLQATEVLKEIAEVGDSLAGRLMVYDALAGRFEEIRYDWDPQNPISGTTPTIRDLSIHAEASAAVACQPA